DPPKWGGISRPDTILIGQGAETAGSSDLRDAILDELRKKAPPPSSSKDDDFAGGTKQAAKETIRIDGLPEGDLADLITASIAKPKDDPTRIAEIGIAADHVARDQGVRAKLAAARDLDEQLGIVADAIQKPLATQSDFAAQGASDIFKGIKDRVYESLSRLRNAPAAAATVVASELRPSLNATATRFLGDVLYYMNGRGTPA